MSANMLHAGPVEPGLVQPEAPASPPPPVPPTPRAPRKGGEQIKDALGRTLTLRAPMSFLDEMDLYALAGERGGVETWMNTVLAAVTVAQITDADGKTIPIAFPRNEVTLRAMLQAVDRAGINALIMHFSPPPDGDTQEALKQLQKQAETQLGN